MAYVLPSLTEALTIRWATPADAAALDALAALDEALVPSPPLLLGLVGDELWVATSVSSGRLISDPFRRSAEIAQLVLERGRQLTVSPPRDLRSRLKRIRHRAPRSGISPRSAPHVSPKAN